MTTNKVFNVDIFLYTFTMIGGRPTQSARHIKLVYGVPTFMPPLLADAIE